MLKMETAIQVTYYKPYKSISVKDVVFGRLYSIEVDACDGVYACKIPVNCWHPSLGYLMRDSVMAEVMLHGPTRDDGIVTRASELTVIRVIPLPEMNVLCTGVLIDGRRAFKPLDALVSDTEDQEWFRNGLHHKDDKSPAIVYEDGNVQSWFKFGKRHRDNGMPAVEIVTPMPRGVQCIHNEWWVNGVFKK
jgi:hypothetical protein